MRKETMAKVPKGASPREIGQLHYDAAMKGDKSTWEATLTKQNQTGRMYRHYWEVCEQRASIGCYYEFGREDRVTDKRAKIFFKRFNADGSPRGRPVPLTLKRDKDQGEEWRVHVASY